MRLLIAVIAIVLASGTVGVRVQEKEESELQKQVADLQAQIAELQKPKLTPEQQTAARLEGFTKAFQSGAGSVEWKACKAAGGKNFAVLIVAGQAAVSCTFEVR